MRVSAVASALADALHWAKPWEWSEHTLTVLTALGTVGAVIVALVLALARWVFETGNRPKLTFTHDPANDVSREDVAMPVFFGTQRATTNTPAAFLRLGVSNQSGRHAASGVEVLVVRIEASEQQQVSGMPSTWEAGQQPGEERKVWKGPVSNLGLLGWTHVEPPELTIGPGIRRTVDLGWKLSETPEFTLAVSPPPRSGSHALTPGTYRITLAVGGANADARHYALTLWFDGRWKPDQAMSDHVAITDGPTRVKPPA